MAICARCGIITEDGLCPHHTNEYGERWAEENRVICDFIHRKKVREETKEEKEERLKLILTQTLPEVPNTIVTEEPIIASTTASPPNPNSVDYFD